MVWIERTILERALLALRGSETRAGHLAQRVTHEHLGYCSVRSESPLCRRHRALVAEIGAALERPRMRRPHAS